MEYPNKATSEDKLYDKITRYRDVILSATRNGDVAAVTIMEPEFLKISNLCSHTYPDGRIAYTYVFDKPMCMICVRKNMR